MTSGVGINKHEMEEGRDDRDERSASSVRGYVARSSVGANCVGFFKVK